MAARVVDARHGATLRALTAVWPTSSGVWPGCHMSLAGAWEAMMLDTLERDASERLRPPVGSLGA